MVQARVSAPPSTVRRMIDHLDDAPMEEAAAVLGPLLLRVPDVATLLAVSVSTVSRLIRRRDLATVEVLGCRRVLYSEVERYCAALADGA